MNQKKAKPLTDFTDKQRKAYKVVMKVLARQELSKSQVYTVIRRAGIYDRHRDIKETSRMLIKNPHTPIEVQNGSVVNKYAESDINA